MQKQISVIVPTYNRAEILGRCLKALEAQTFPHDQFEVVICDDGSSDNTQSVIAEFSGRLSIQSLRQENKGPATARNRAIAVAKAPLLLIINDDSILAPDAIKRHVAASAYRIINIGNFRTPPDLKRDFFTALVDSTTWIFPFVHMKKPSVQNFDLFLTANLSLPAAAFKEVGGFDETFPSPAGEDIELGYRLSKVGYTIMYDPAIECFHDNIFTPQGFARLRYMRGVEDMRFLNKYPELVGHYQELCIAISKRWYTRLKKEPEALTRKAQEAAQQLEKVIDEYNNMAANNRSAEHYRLIEKAYRYFDHVGFMSYVDGMCNSEYFEKIIGPIAIPFGSKPAPSIDDLFVEALRMAA